MSNKNYKFTHEDGKTDVDIFEELGEEMIRDMEQEAKWEEERTIKSEGEDMDERKEREFRRAYYNFHG